MDNSISDKLIILFFIISCLLLQWWFPAWLARLEGIYYDFKIMQAPVSQSNSIANIQIVDIDNDSLTEIGRWPWRREKLAKLVNELKQQGAIVISFDMLFTEPQQNLVLDNQASFQQLSNEQLQLLIEQFDDDSKLAQSFNGIDVVLGMLFHHQQPKGQLKPSVIHQKQLIKTQYLHQFKGVDANIDTYNNTAIGQGYLNATLDADGFIRRTALVSLFQHQLYPSLALETYRIYSLAEAIEPQFLDQQQQQILTGLKIGDAFVPTDERGQMLLPFQPKQQFNYTSAKDLLKHRITDHRFEQAVVFIGTSAIGLADLRTTPISLVLPGIEVHATAFKALLQPENLIYRPDWWLAANSLLLVVLALLLSRLLRNLSPLSMSFCALASLALLTALNISLWHVYLLDLPIMSLWFCLFSISSYRIVQGFLSENQRRKQVKAIFDQYVPPAHIDQLLAQPELIETTGERKQLTVLFSDIRGFTQISEQLSAHQLTRLLNQFFTPITDIIFHHQGTIDKYVGDMVMAFWGAPLIDEKHAEHALATALEMLVKTQQISKQFEQQGLPHIDIGIGINTGNMNVGDMGSKFRRAYTVIGDAVNLGSRLESLTKYYQVALLVSETTERAAPDFCYQVIDKVRVKGKQQAITIYTVWPSSLHAKELSASFEVMFQAYLAKDFNQAQQHLFNYQKLSGVPRLVEIYQQRISYFLANPPDQNWDGTYTHSNK